ncbi:MAG: hypothetical protein HY435_00695 [Candidatus Liptonbacteria bacterium]|nr:hypothetical protein [Candidatus Liptonbacteria bacterium]
MQEHDTKAPVQKTSPRDFFLHLLAVITLYVSAVSFTTLLFQFINYFFPDPLLETYYVRESIVGPIRWAVASLLVIFPVFAFTTRFLNKNYAKTPYLRNLRIRRWLIYFTLFAASLIIIGDLVALIFRLLGGEITARFVLKVFALLAVTGSIFGYYLWDLREEKRFNIRPFVYGLIGVIAVAMIGAFFVVGSPKEARLVRADETRVNNLSQIQWEVVNYWQSKEKLPDTLASLRDDIRGFMPPQDPETGAGYEYRTTGRLSFELCATFNRATRNREYSRFYPTKPIPAPEFSGSFIEDTWEHGEGRTCFERTIDPDRYPPFSKNRN